MSLMLPMKSSKPCSHQTDAKGRRRRTLHTAATAATSCYVFGGWTTDGCRGTDDSSSARKTIPFIHSATRFLCAVEPIRGWQKQTKEDSITRQEGKLIGKPNERAWQARRMLQLGQSYPFRKAFKRMTLLEQLKVGTGSQHSRQVCPSTALTARFARSHCPCAWHG